jgi:hypothetical protein
VDVSIDGAQSARFACADGFKVPGVQTPYLTAGTHTIEFTALSDSGYPYYRFSGSLQTVSNDPISAEYRLAWAVGGAAVRWELTNGSTGLSCSGAGVTQMNVNFKDSAGNWVYGSGDLQACDAAPIVYNFLLPGTYRVFISGTGPGGNYYSNGNNPPTLTVTAGQFVGPESALPVTMWRQ